MHTLPHAMPHRLRRQTLKAALMALVLAGSAHAALAQNLTIGVRAGPSSLDPHFASTGPETSAARNVFESLIRRSPSFELEPGLATSWQRVGEDAWEFKLREGVTWHDGRPFTAADVAYTIRRVPGAAGASGGFRPYVRAIRDVQVVDDHTIRFLTNGPALTLPGELAGVAIVSEAAVTAAGEDGFRNGRAMVGTAPYRFVSWQSGGAQILSRWDRHWEGRPAWERVTIREIPNDGTRIATLLSGEVDLINYVPPSGISTLQANPALGVFQTPSLFVYILHPDARETSPLVTGPDGAPLATNPFRDARVRRAMSMAINRPAIARVTMEGLATPAHHLMPLSFVGVDPQTPELPFDVAAARRLMAEAGYPNGFRVRLNCTNNRLPNDDKVCAALAPMLMRIGIQADVAAVPSATYFSDFSRGNYSLAMNGWGTNSGDASFLLSALAYTRGLDPALGTFNRVRYSNPEVDRITRAALAATTEDARVALLRQGMGVMIEEMALIPIVNLSAVWAGDARKLRYVAQMSEDTLAAAAIPARP